MYTMCISQRLSRFLVKQLVHGCRDSGVFLGGMSGAVYFPTVTPYEFFLRLLAVVDDEHLTKMTHSIRCLNTSLRSIPTASALVPPRTTTGMSEKNGTIWVHFERGLNTQQHGDIFIIH